MKKFLRKMMIFLLLSSMLLSVIPLPVAKAVYGNGYVGGRSGDGAGIYAHGVDISQWQGGEVDYNKIKAQGYSFVILRAGFSVYQDKYFERNYAAAKKAGLHVGVYLYSYADTVPEVLREAEALKGWLADKTLEYPVYYDMEEPETHGKMSAPALTELSLAFLDSVAQDGWLVGLYSCKSWLESKLETDKICEKYECWMGLYLPSGSYDTYDRYDEYCGIWQYSSTGSVDGVPGNVDMNVAFKDYPSICMQYGLNGYVASGESLSLSGSREIPKVIATGERIAISGRVFSNDGPLSDVTVGIYDQDGTKLMGRSAGPRTENFDISEIASSVNTADLSEGKYVYRVVATNRRGTKTLLRQEFVVSEIGLMTTAVDGPDHLHEGQWYTPQGELHASTILNEVSIIVGDRNGNEILRATTQPKTDTYALYAMQSMLNIQSLTMGEYSYTVCVTTQIGTQTVFSAPFFIWLENDPITLEGIVLQSEYHLNELTTLTGSLTSQHSALRTVSVTIENQKQEVLLSAVSTDGEKTASLEELSTQLHLNSLPYGTYICRIDATNDAGPVNVTLKQFVIRPDGLSLCELNAPSIIYCGDAFRLTGVVASDDSPVKMISVAVLDEFGQVVLDDAVVTNVMVYDLDEIGKNLCFSDLRAGIYTLRIRAENETTAQILYDARFHVTDLNDSVTWDGLHASVNGISFAGYDEIQLYGVLYSKKSDIQSVKAEVFSQEGILTNAAEFEPMSMRADISELNHMLRISALAEGKYRLVITAENETAEFIMLDEMFRVSECAHEHVRSGVIHEQRCDRMGAICDSRCSVCGERTQIGQMIPADEHQWQDDCCKHCGRVKMDIYTLVPALSFSHMGRYMIAFQSENSWYALNIWGETVLIDAPENDGTISAGADLLWAAKVKGQDVALCNPFGQYLHLNSDGLCVAAGRVHTRLTVYSYGAFHQFCNDQASRMLSFADGLFGVGTEAERFAVFELPREGK